MNLKNGLVGLVSASLILSPLSSRAAEAEVIIDKNKTLTWGPWTNDFFVTATSKQNGYVSGNTNDWIEEGNTNYNIHAIANSNYLFTGWTGAPEGLELVNPINFPVYTPINITATFDSSTSTSTTTSTTSLTRPYITGMEIESEGTYLNVTPTFTNYNYTIREFPSLNPGIPQNLEEFPGDEGSSTFLVTNKPSSQSVFYDIMVSD